MRRNPVAAPSLQCQASKTPTSRHRTAQNAPAAPEAAATPEADGRRRSAVNARTAANRNAGPASVCKRLAMAAASPTTANETKTNASTLQTSEVCGQGAG